MSGGILSHDFVEAALMRRAGYHVWLVSDLTGSYEQQPPDLLSELQRDRRWCQGNLQNARLIAEPGIHPVHRSMFAIGAMSYLSAPMWLAFLSLGTALWMSGAAVLPAWEALPGELRALWAWTLCLLFMPRLLGLAAVFLKGEQQQFGGAGALLRSAAAETVLAVLQAPIRMVAHSLFVFIAITGVKLDWKSPPREATMVPWSDAASRLAPMTLTFAGVALAIASLEPGALMWLAPVALPLLLAVPLVVLTSHVELGGWMRTRGLLLIPEESRSPQVLRRAWFHAQAA
jgi:membrane glycosyltransferase